MTKIYEVEMSVLQEFTDEELAAEISRRFELKIRSLKAMPVERLYLLSLGCLEDSHEDGINCLSCEAWLVYASLPDEIREGAK